MTHTPFTFRLTHGDPARWCSAEVDEYLDACDRSKDTVQRLERAAAAAQAGATAPQIIAAFTGEPGGDR